MTQKPNHRQPAHLEMAGGKSKRQQIWETLRKQKKFTVSSIENVTRINLDTIADYLRALERASVIAGCKQPRSVVRQLYTSKQYMLIDDRGIEAPRVKRDGSIVVMGLVNEQMWRSMRILKGNFTIVELARSASTPETPVTENTVQTYLKFLKLAGYLAHIAGKPTVGQGRTPDLYRLLPGKYTGPRPPMIQRVKQVYDPNLGRIVYAEEPAEVEAA